MAGEGARLIRRLQPPHVGTAPDQRSALLRRLARATGADFAAFIKFASSSGGERYAAIERVGSLEMDERWGELVGRPVLPSTFDVTCPCAGDVNQFLDLSVAPHSDADRRGLQIWSRYYGPFHVTDQLRTLIYHQRELVGWVGLVKRRGKFSKEAVRAVNHNFDRIEAAFGAVHVREHAEELQSVYALLDGGGTCRASSQVTADWAAVLPDARQHVLRMRRNEAESSEEFLIGSHYSGRVVRLQHGDDSHYLLRLSPTRRLLLPTSVALTARQGEVAQLLVSDRTMDEIGAELGISRDGVKHHVREIYRRLGVGNRVELRCEITNEM